MVLTVAAVENTTEYIFTVTDGTEENIFVYSWGKVDSEGNPTDLQMCKNEALLLAQWEIDQKAEPTAIQL